MLSKNKVNYIQSLCHKKKRAEEKLFIVEGNKIITTILTQKPQLIHSIYALPNWIKENEKHLKNNLLVEAIEEASLKKISSLSTPNDVLALLYMEKGEGLPNPNKEWVLVLDGIQDPGNMGTIIRIADWFGVKQIVCSNETVDYYNSKALQSTMGSFLNVTIHYTNLVQYCIANKAAKTYAALLNGLDIRKAKPNKNGILIIGNEGKGISKELLELMHQPISIVGNGEAESLNAAVATGIILSHLIP
jgi:TrmH family RNA methyltransferase